MNKTNSKELEEAYKVQEESTPEESTPEDN